MSWKINCKQIVKWLVANLNQHPDQSLTSGPPSEAVIEELAASMDRNGLLHPIEILPDGTILAGRKRAEAANRLGWTEIDVSIRADIVDEHHGKEAPTEEAN